MADLRSALAVLPGELPVVVRAGFSFVRDARVERIEDWRQVDGDTVFEPGETLALVLDGYYRP